MLSFLRRRTQDPDEMVLEQLRRRGSNLEAPHPISFHLDFEAEAPAYSARDTLRESGYDARVLVSEDGSVFRCAAVKTLVPELQTLRKLSREMGAFASTAGGVYDGWEAKVVV